MVSRIGRPDYGNDIYPLLQRLIIPVLVTPKGEVIQDGTDISNYLDEVKLGQEPIYPDDIIMKSYRTVNRALSS